MYNYSGSPSENVTVPEWKDYTQEKPRAGKWVCIIDESGRFYVAVRPKGKEKPFFAAGHCVEHPLFWCEKPTLI